MKIKCSKMDDQQKILSYLIAAETQADEILGDKRKIIMLDKKRNENREALRDLTKSGQKMCMISIGSILMKKSVEEARQLLEKDQKQIDIDINQLRSELKLKVNNLRDLEMLPPVPGLNLVPLSDKETAAFSNAGMIPR